MRRFLTTVAAVAVFSFGASATTATPLPAADDYIPPVIGGIYGVGANGPGSYAVLIDVHGVEKDKGKPGGAANCSNAQASNGTWTGTGWIIDSPRTAHLNLATVPATLGSVTSTLQSSWNAWPAAAPRVTVAADGTVSRYTANRSYDLMFGRTGGSLATTYTWRWNDGFVESDVVFDSGVTWFQAGSEGDGCIETAGNKYDVANIATHEFGHAYGLGHPSGDRFETMYAYGYSGETLKRSPSTGDQAGINALY